MCLPHFRPISPPHMLARATLRAWASSLEDWAAHEGLDIAVRAVILAEVMACVMIISSG